MSQIVISNLSFSYSSFYDPIFEQVNLTLDSSWRLGLIARNGKGKTTLLKLLMGEYEYSGQIQSNVNFLYFPYPLNNEQQLSINVAYEIHPSLEEWQLVRELNLLKMDPDCLWQPFAQLSPGEQSKLMLAILFLMPDHFLLIDEPTNHLDLLGREIVAQYLKSKSGFILVSHDRYFLDETIDHVLSINRSSIQLEQGNYSSWLVNRQRQNQFEEKENLKLQGQIRQLNQAAERTSSWSKKAEAAKFGQGSVDRGYIGHKSAKMMQRAKSIEKRVKRASTEKAGLLHDIERSYALRIHPQAYHSKLLCRANALSFGYGDKLLVEDLNFTIEQGDKIAITGANGSGKSTLLKLIAGLLPSDEESDFWMKGDFTRASQLQLSYMPQDTKGLSGSLSDFSKENKIDDSLFRAILNKMDFPSLQFAKDIASYSAGQKKKVLLARSLSESAHLYVWDEALNYIDLMSRMQIETLIDDDDLTLVMVEHDRLFIDTVANKIIQFTDDQI